MGLFGFFIATAFSDGNFTHKKQNLATKRDNNMQKKIPVTLKYENGLKCI